MMQLFAALRLPLRLCVKQIYRLKLRTKPQSPLALT